MKGGACLWNIDGVHSGNCTSGNQRVFDNRGRVFDELMKGCSYDKNVAVSGTDGTWSASGRFLLCFLLSAEQAGLALHNLLCYHVIAGLGPVSYTHLTLPTTPYV